MKLVVEKFPESESTSKFNDLCEKVNHLYDEIDKEDKAGMDAVNLVLKPHLEQLSEKINVYYAEDVLLQIKKVDASMDFMNLEFEPSFQETLGRVCDALPVLEKAHQKSGGWLLPHIYSNFARLAGDLKGLLIDTPRCAECIKGEHLDSKGARAIMELATGLCPDKFRGGLSHEGGKDMDWIAFIDKFQKSSIVLQCKEYLVKEVRPVIDETRTTVTMLLKSATFEPAADNISALDLLVTEKLEKDLETITHYAANAGDLELQAQLAQFTNLVRLAKAVLTVMKRIEKAGTTNDFLMHTDNVPVVSALRRALRTSGAQVALLPNIFKKSEDTKHINDFDDDSHANDIGIFR
jgi:hypothetical protein